MATLTELLIDEVPEGFVKAADWTVGPDLLMNGERPMNGVEPVAMAQLGFQRGHGRNWADEAGYQASARWLQAIVYEFATADGARRHAAAEFPGPQRSRPFTIPDIPGCRGWLYEHTWGHRRAFVGFVHDVRYYLLAVNTLDVDETLSLLEPWVRRQYEIVTATEA